MNTTHQTDQTIKKNLHTLIILTICPLGTVLNSTVVYLMLFYKQLRKRWSNICLLNLLLSNVFASLSLLIIHVYIVQHELEAYSLHSVMLYRSDIKIVMSVFTLLSLVNLSILTLDRFLAVKYPYLYQKVTKKHVAMVIGTAWIFAAVYALILTILFLIRQYTIILHVLAVSYSFVIFSGILVLASSNTVIYIEAKKQLVAISKLSVQSRNVASLHHKEYRLIRITLFMVVTYICCWLPATISGWYFYVHRRSLSLEFEIVALYLMSINYICDPLIYVSLSKDVKKQLRNIFHRSHT